MLLYTVISIMSIPQNLRQTIMVIYCQNKNVNNIQ